MSYKSEQALEEHKEDLIEKFQCPGCVGGPGPGECENFEFLELDGHVRCEAHVPGTRMMGVRSSLMCIGLPKGFMRVSGHKDKSEPHMRMWCKEGYKPHWDTFNVAVWAMEKDGFLFVRTFMPRVDVTVVDVVEGGTMDMVPGAIDVGKFVDEID